jgi:hypothetical protein
MSIECPLCGLVSPPTAVRCDCGYDFVSKKVERSYLVEKIDTQYAGAIVRRAKRTIVLESVGAIVCGLVMLVLVFWARRGLYMAGLGIAAILWGATRVLRVRAVPDDPTSAWKEWR